ncbi:YcaO-like family protein [Pseudomonas sp. O230]|uniref:YcaO-like family protein n=1 Tax=Pseudomonas sp. O230 TaxID=3159450 RepID=UPI00387B0862
MHRLSSSLRQRSALETIKIAEAIAPSLGITRVTDTTWLDRIGIPVYASIRPAAKSGSLCVNAGKGLIEEEAKIGAYMEAIEFSLAEYGNSPIVALKSTPTQLVESHTGKVDFVDFCVNYGLKANPEKLLMVVEAEELVNGGTALVPAGLVFIPYTQNQGQKLFGQSSNGLASGNDLLEASVHGLCELIERDIQAFDMIENTSNFLEIDTFSQAIENLISKIKNAELDIVVRHTDNFFGLPYFQAFIMEAFPGAPISIATGTGCHPIKEVALIRAISEAAQSRLSHIHGGRDDIIQRVEYFKRAGRNKEIEAINLLRQKAHDQSNTIKYSTIKDHEKNITSLADAWRILATAVKKVGVKSILRVTLTQPNDLIQVVRIIAPKLESFDKDLKRIGPRLLKYAKNKL